MAGFNINSFKSDLSQSGVLHTNKFIVAFVSPPVMQQVSIDGQPVIHTERLMQTRADAVKIPGVALLMTDIARYGNGPMQKMPHNATFTPNSITFLSDRNGEIYKYFYTWMNKIFDFSGTDSAGAAYTTEYKTNYTTDLHVYVYDQAGNQIKDIVMYQAFPESVNDINVGWNDTNQLMKITVTFSFRDWAMLGVGSALPTTQQGSIPSQNVQKLLSNNTPSILSTPLESNRTSFSAQISGPGGQQLVQQLQQSFARNP